MFCLAPFSSCRSSKEEPFTNILEEIPDTNTAVPKAEEKFKTFIWSKDSGKRKNATEEEEKRYDESREALTLRPMLLFISDFSLIVQQTHYFDFWLKRYASAQQPFESRGKNFLA